MRYDEFLKSKIKFDPASGFSGDVNLHHGLFDFQRDIVRWALIRGRAAIFAQTGLGKTLMELSWASEVNRITSLPVLVLAPLAVAHQITREGDKFGMAARFVSDQSECWPGINVTNYAKLHKFDLSKFSGVVLDESSILKSFTGKTRKLLIDSCAAIPYRLAATATPAPNDFMELGNHAEFLGVMSLAGMQATFFTHDGGDTSKWRLKGHAEARFWEWMCSWSVLVRKPSDLGYDDSAYVLPYLHQIEHHVAVDGDIAQTLSERIKARRASIPYRVAKAIELTPSDGPFVWWCNMNAESEALADGIPGAVELRGSDTDERKEQTLTAFAAGDIRVLVTKPTLTGFGLNWQHCCNTGFVGLNDSFEQVYQAVRRFWRFGQKSEVTAHFVAASTEGAVLANLKRKEAEADRMGAMMVAHMGEISERIIHGASLDIDPYHANIEMINPEWISHELY